MAGKGYSRHDTGGTVHPLRQAWQQRVFELMGPDRDQHAQGTDNFARYRFGPSAPDRTYALNRWRQIIDEHMDRFAGTWDLLADDASRAVLLECLTFNAFGWRMVRRAKNTPEYQDFVKALASEAGHPAFPMLQRNVRPIRHKHLHMHHLLEDDLKLVTSDGFFINVMHNRQYFLERPGVSTGPREGDVVLDCGAGWGDTSMLFGRKVGPDGLVVGFEFTPSNVSAIRQHFVMNEEMRNRVKIITHPLGEKSGQSVSFDDMATSTRTTAKGKHRAETRSIDDVVHVMKLPKVDVIKMDIEGAEYAALRGAVRTIRRFGPRLSISAYHRPDDLFVLPMLIQAIRPDYTFYLDHHTIHHEETVLYAIPPAS